MRFMPVPQTQLDDLWNFDDPDASAARFAAAAGRTTGQERAELETQRARAWGLLGRYDEADAVLDAITDGSDVVQTRIALERGRLRNSSGDPDAAVPLFQKAAALAASADLTFLQVDALHMLAIAHTPHATDWADRALVVLEDTDDPRTLRWRVALYNNAGWTHLGAGRPEESLAAFENAKDAAVRWGTPQQVRWADEAVVTARQATERPRRPAG
jgi:tetratricopeptide (TPR) repeat protein